MFRYVSTDGCEDILEKQYFLSYIRKRIVIDTRRRMTCCGGKLMWIFLLLTRISRARSKISEKEEIRDELYICESHRAERFCERATRFCAGATQCPSCTRDILELDPYTPFLTRQYLQSPTTRFRIHIHLGLCSPTSFCAERASFGARCGRGGLCGRGRL